MAKKKKLRQTEDRASDDEVKTRKTRANRKELNARTNQEIEELDALLDDPEKMVEYLRAQRAIKEEEVTKREEAMAEEKGKKAATYFQDIARHCKDSMLEYPQLDPQTLRDVAITALDKFLDNITNGE